jgi:CheY-like chemotaxis protein
VPWRLEQSATVRKLAPPGRRPLLVLADDGVLGEALARLLEFAGYAVLTADDTRTALDACRRWSPALVVVDRFEARRGEIAFADAAVRDLGALTPPVLVLHDAVPPFLAEPVLLPRPFEPVELLCAIDALTGLAPVWLD